MIFIDINILYSKVIKSSVSQMRSRDTNDSTCVIYGPSENEAGEITSSLTIWLFPLSVTGVPQLWQLSGGRKVTPGGDMRTDYMLLTPRRELISYMSQRLALPNTQDSLHLLCDLLAAKSMDAVRRF